MSIIFNGTEIDNKAGDMVFNGVNLTEVKFNNTTVWAQRAAPGSQTFTASGTFTVPFGYTEVTICMCGGGGGGAAVQFYDTSPTLGGGYAGQVISQVVSGLVGGQLINIMIGTGGAGAVSYGTASAGTASYFDAISANGGAAGSNTSASYAGSGASRITCGGTYYDGSSDLTAYGGQAGTFGNGGAGVYSNSLTVSGGAGGVGAGGGSAASTASVYGGTGGRGQCIVSWS